jgi:hypothetical protein
VREAGKAHGISDSPRALAVPSCGSWVACPSATEGGCNVRSDGGVDGDTAEAIAPKGGYGRGYLGARRRRWCDVMRHRRRSGRISGIMRQQVFCCALSHGAAGLGMRPWRREPPRGAQEGRTMLRKQILTNRAPCRPHGYAARVFCCSSHSTTRGRVRGTRRREDICQDGMEFALASRYHSAAAVLRSRDRGLGRTLLRATTVLSMRGTLRRRAEQHIDRTPPGRRRSHEDGSIRDR